MSTTTTATTTNQERAEALIGHTTAYTFTLTFKGDRIAILEVRGAASQEEAHTAAQSALPQCQYTVTDGDQTGGRAEIFYLWCSAQAQERQTLLHPRKEAQA